MVCQPLRLALLIGAITAVAVSPASANFRAPRGCCDPCGSSSAPTAPAFRTVTCYEWVRESVPVKRTVYKVECRTEQYDTCRWECVPVQRERTVCVTKHVPTWETRKVCHKVNVCEERTVNKTCYKNVQETCMQKKLVRHGHWECKEVCPLFGNGGGLFGGHGHGNGCCDSGCGNNNGCNDSCRPARTRKVWVHCPEYQECPVTVCKKVCYTEQVKVKVNVCRDVWKEEKVCVNKCVTENRVEKCTVMERRQVPCKATRTVRVCVPCEETVNCCKWVRKEVTRQVPCAPACTTTSNCCEREGLFSRLHNRSNGCCGQDRGCGHARGGCCN